MERVGDKEWADAKRQALRALTKLAKAEGTITYKRFVRKIKAIADLGFYEDQRMDDLLDEVSREEDAAGRGLISVLVVELMTEIPSDGFFALTDGRYPDGLGRREIFERERDLVYRAHSS